MTARMARARWMRLPLAEATLHTGRRAIPRLYSLSAQRLRRG
jgi:hypothetical protein